MCMVVFALGQGEGVDTIVEAGGAVVESGRVVDWTIGSDTMKKTFKQYCEILWDARKAKNRRKNAERVCVFERELENILHKWWFVICRVYIGPN